MDKNEHIEEARGEVTAAHVRAQKVFDTIVGLKPTDTVLFIVAKDEKPSVLNLIQTMREALQQRGIAYTTVEGNEEMMEEELLDAVKKHNIVMCSWGMEDSDISFEHITDIVSETRGRLAFFPGLDEESLSDNGALAEDPVALDMRLRRMEKNLEDMAGFHIRSSYGTDLVVPLKRGERRWFRETGAITEGGWGNLPYGEIFTTPDEMKVNGVLVLPTMDTEVTGEQGVDEFVKLTIHNGHIVQIDGGVSADRLRAYFEEKSREEINSHDPYGVVRVAEIAFGANEHARTVPSNPGGSYTEPGHPTVETEKRYGTMHLAFGSSQHGEEGTEGFTNVDPHLDFVIPRNGLTVTGFRYMDDLEKRKNGVRLIDEGRVHLA